jgi:hypothetical protein
MRAAASALVPGRLMADLVSGGAPIVDPTPFRYKR